MLILPGADVAAQSPGVVNAETIKTLLPVSKLIKANFIAPVILEKPKPECYDNILIVARESLEDEAGSDAASISTCLTLRRLLPAEGRCPALTVELLAGENRFLFDERNDDVIISPLLVSYSMSQTALQRGLAALLA